MQTARRAHHLTLGLALALTMCGTSACEATTDPDQIGPPRVLFVGNSLTYYNDMPEMFARLARSMDRTVDVAQEAHGGWILEDHASSADTLAAIDSGNWDYVVLQEGSTLPAYTNGPDESMYPSARTLDARIRQAGARTVFFVTWGLRDGHERTGHADYGRMQHTIEVAYRGIAQELGAMQSPVGVAWQRALGERPNLELWKRDGRHPSRAGSYLAACVHYATIYQASPLGAQYDAGLDPEAVAFLQRIAALTVGVGH